MLSSQLHGFVYMHAWVPSTQNTASFMEVVTKMHGLNLPSTGHLEFPVLNVLYIPDYPYQQGINLRYIKPHCFV